VNSEETDFLCSIWKVKISKSFHARECCDKVHVWKHQSGSIIVSAFGSGCD
jgi:hypothetical protein